MPDTSTNDTMRCNNSRTSASRKNNDNKNNNNNNDKDEEQEVTSMDTVTTDVMENRKRK